MVFSNNNDDFFRNIDKLPDVLIEIVQSFIPKVVTIFLTKENYLRDHHLVKNIINLNNGNIELYIRCMVRQDNDFVFRQLLVENYERWFNMKKYYYKETIYANYVIFLDSYAIDNESIKCRQKINELFEELGLSKNQHKKKSSRYIRWKN